MPARPGGDPLRLATRRSFRISYTAFEAQLEQLWTGATPTSGDVHYLAIRDDDSFASDQRAPPNPVAAFAVSLESVSITRGNPAGPFDFVPGQGTAQRATRRGEASRDPQHPHASTVPHQPTSLPLWYPRTASCSGTHVRDAAPFESEDRSRSRRHFLEQPKQSQRCPSSILFSASCVLRKRRDHDLGRIPRHVSAVDRDVAHERRRNEAVVRARRQEDGVDLRHQVGVGVRDLQLVFEVGCGAQTADDDARADLRDKSR